jgi:hypothetical protein
MGYQILTPDPNERATGEGAFYIQHRETGHWFYAERSPELVLAPPAHGGRNIDYLHRIEVAHDPVGMSRWRSAHIGKTVAYVITDEGDDGRLIVERWPIKNPH